jgi:excisionase family DNA binding protein
LVTAEELAAEWGLSRKVVYRLAREGALPTIRLAGRSIRFDRAEVELFLRRGGAPRGCGNHSEDVE